GRRRRGSSLPLARGRGGASEPGRPCGERPRRPASRRLRARAGREAERMRGRYWRSRQPPFRGERITKARPPVTPDTASSEESAGPPIPTAGPRTGTIARTTGRTRESRATNTEED